MRGKSPWNITINSGNSCREPFAEDRIPPRSGWWPKKTSGIVDLTPPTWVDAIVTTKITPSGSGIPVTKPSHLLLESWANRRLSGFQQFLPGSPTVLSFSFESKPPKKPPPRSLGYIRERNSMSAIKRLCAFAAKVQWQTDSPNECGRWDATVSITNRTAPQMERAVGTVRLQGAGTSASSSRDS